MANPIAPDFWLPERLAKLAVVIEGERTAYTEFIKITKRWLDTIRDPVLHPGGVAGIDPNGVYAGDLVWRDGLAEFADAAVIPLLGRAYVEQFDENFPFTNRPYVAQHVATVHDRLVNIPDEVFNNIRTALQTGIDRGSSIPEIAAQVRADILDAGGQLWKNRATTVARTEAIAAYNAGTNDAFHAVEEVLDVPMEKVWLATDDDRTRHTHRLADGQRVPLDAAFTVGEASLEFPGDPTGPPQEVIQCRCTMLMVEPGEELDLSDRQLLASAIPAFTQATTLMRALMAAGEPFDMAVVDAWDHSLCLLEFCRNPLHPGPCKGWKHTLKKIAPGVYDALEKARVEKLEAKRKEKIAKLKAEGKPIPKSLLKPIAPKEPKPPPATPGTTGVPPMVGTEAPLSPATEEKLKAVSAKVKNEFDPATVAAKKAAAEKAKKLAAEQKAAAEKAEADKKAAAAAAQAAKAAAPPKVDSDAPKTPAGFVPTDEQDQAMKAATGEITDPQAKAEAYRDLTPDDFNELPAHAKAKILADMGTLADHPDLAPLDQGMIKGKFFDFTGKLPAKPKKPDSPEPITPGSKAGLPEPEASPEKSLAKAELILTTGATDSGKLAIGYNNLSKTEFDALPPHAQAKLLADLQGIAHKPENKGPVADVAKSHYESYTGQKLPAGNPPAKAAPAADEPHKVDVPATPTAITATPAAAKAAGIAANPKGTHWKDRITAYSDLSQADVDSLDDADLNAVVADLEALHAWHQKKGLSFGAKAVASLLDDLADKISNKGAPSSAVPDDVSAPPKAPGKPAQAKQKGVPPANLKSTGKVLGTHGATVHTDEDGQQWLVKKQAPFLNEADVATADLAKAAGLPAAEIHQTTVAGKPASVQKMIKAKAAFGGSKKVNPSQLKPAQIMQLQKAQVLDWLTSNHDAHGGQFLEDDDGNLIAIDKTQSFKHFGTDQLDPNYHPNAAYGEVEPVYNQMWKAYANGQDITMADPTKGELADFISSVQNMDDDEFKDMFRAYAQAAAKEGKLALGTPYANDPDAFLDALVQRKNGLAGSFAKLYEDAKLKRAQKQAKDAGPTSGVAEAGVTPAAAPAPPVLNQWQQNAVDAMDDPAKTPMQKANAAASLTKPEYLGLPPEGKAKILDALLAENTPLAWQVYEGFTEVPHPGAAHASSTATAPAPAADEVQLPTPPKDTFKEWQDAKNVVKAKKGLKGAASTVAKAIGTGTVSDRLNAYSALANQANFDKLPPEIQSAIIRDLDNIAQAPGNFFTPIQVALATTLRQQLTGAGIGSPKSPTFGQPKKFTSQAAEKAYHIANNPDLHSTADKLAAYNKLSATGFASLPPATQQKIAQDLTAIADDSSVSLTTSNGAILAHKKLTGVAAGAFTEAVTPPKKAPAKKKFASPTAEAAHNAAQTPVGYSTPAAEKQAKFDTYQQLTAAELESLPTTTQKAIHQQILNLTYGGSPISHSDQNALLDKLGMGHYGWKPKTAAQKKAEAIAKMSPAEQAQLAADYNESGDYQQKLKKAITGSGALASVPRSLSAGGARNLSATPTTDGVTGAQMAASVGAYKGTTYHSVNSLLRNQKTGYQSTGSSSDAHIRNIDAAMTASRLPTPVQAWRGVPGPAVFGSALNGDMTGIEFTEWGYGSTSTNRSTSAGFAGGGSTAVMMRVLIPPGVGAVQVSGAEYESEILLQRGLRWRIVADNGIGSDGRRNIDVEVIYP